jgi:hypothetical protein
LSRINLLGESVIDNNKAIQKSLFFLPWEANDYPDLRGVINPFISCFFYPDPGRGQENMEYDFGPARFSGEETDSDEGVWQADEDYAFIHAFDWKRIENIPRFME